MLFDDQHRCSRGSRNKTETSWLQALTGNYCYFMQQLPVHNLHMSTVQIKTMKGYVTITVSSFTQVSGVIQVVIMILGSKRPKYSDDLVFVGKPLMFKW